MSHTMEALRRIAFPTVWTIPNAAASATERLGALAAPCERSDEERLTDCIEEMTLVLLAAYRTQAKLEDPAAPQAPELSPCGSAWFAETRADVRLAAYSALHIEALRDLTDHVLYGDDGEVGRTARARALLDLATLTRDSWAIARLRRFCPPNRVCRT